MVWLALQSKPFPEIMKLDKAKTFLVKTRSYNKNLNR